MSHAQVAVPATTLRVPAVPARQFASGDADKPRDATTRDDASSRGMASAVWDAFLLIDPLLPTGGFAHSLGLEPTLLSGALADDGDVRTVGAFVEDVGQNALDAQVPFVLAARECAACEDPARGLERWRRVNAECRAMCASNGVNRRASESMGSALLRATTTAFGGEDADDGTAAFLAAIRRHSRGKPREAPQQACVFGAACAAVGFDALTTVRAFVYLATRDACSAATRLNASGPLETVAALRRVSIAAEPACARAVAAYESHLRARVSRADDDDNDDDVFVSRVSRAATSAPIADLVQGAHDDCAARLFNS